MARSFVLFVKPVSPETATALINAVRSAATEVDQNQANRWTSVMVAISSGGGDIGAALACYNEMVATDIVLDTHNSGQVDSAAILPFMAGKRRTAAEHTAFLFHQPQWGFHGATGNTLTVVADAERWLSTYQLAIARIVAADTKMKEADVVRMMKDGTTLSAVEAKELGLIHEIEQPKFPKNGRWFFA